MEEVKMGDKVYEFVIIITDKKSGRVASVKHGVANDPMDVVKAMTRYESKNASRETKLMPEGVKKDALLFLLKVGTQNSKFEVYAGGER